MLSDCNMKFVCHLNLLQQLLVHWAYIKANIHAGLQRHISFVSARVWFISRVPRRSSGFLSQSYYEFSPLSLVVCSLFLSVPGTHKVTDLISIHIPISARPSANWVDGRGTVRLICCYSFRGRLSLRCWHSDWRRAFAYARTTIWDSLDLKYLIKSSMLTGSDKCVGFMCDCFHFRRPVGFYRCRVAENISSWTLGNIRHFLSKFRWEHRYRSCVF